MMMIYSAEGIIIVFGKCLVLMYSSSAIIYLLFNLQDREVFLIIAASFGGYRNINLHVCMMNSASMRRCAKPIPGISDYLTY